MRLGGEDMNNREIAFIICVNNEQYYNECVRYIQELDVPELYTIDIIAVQEAESMAAGYNAGMQSSNAKYKVYLHQDTFIVNRKFIFDILNVFKNNDEIGMLGVLGVDVLPEDANCYLSWKVGRTYVYNGEKSIDVICSHEKMCKSVEAIDGMLMVTQYDVPWRENVFDGWDFYDVSQSIEMRKKGYSIVVPYQEEAWCYHDCGPSNIKRYDFYRKIAIKEYCEFFLDEVDEQACLDRVHNIEEHDVVAKRLIDVIEKYGMKELLSFIDDVRSVEAENKQIAIIKMLAEIFKLEKENVFKTHSEFFFVDSWSGMVEYYNAIRFVMMRMKFERRDERTLELKQLIEDKRVSHDAVRLIGSSIMDDASEKYLELLEDRNEKPLVSVIVAVYNGAEFVGETIESILNQSYKNIELIIVDDASTDNSKEIILSYQDSRIKPIFLEKNRHVCNAGNIGFEAAVGKYIALCGHDDVWKKDKLEKQIAFLEEHLDYGACFTLTKTIDENGNTGNAKMDARFEHRNMSQDAIYRNLLLSGNFLCAPSACIRKEILEKVGYYRYALVQLQDYDLWLRVSACSSIYIIQEKLTLYRKFSKEGINLSSASIATSNRDMHETQWIRRASVNSLSNKDFKRMLGVYMRNKNANTYIEFLCEKAFLLWEMRNCLVEQDFIEMLEDKEIRKVLEEKYNFTLQDFYKMNMQQLRFDNQDSYLIDDLKYIIAEKNQMADILLDELAKLSDGKEVLMRVKTYMERLNNKN